MKTQDYHSSITAHISAKEAFEKIADVNDWWTANFEGSAKKLNDVFTVRFGETFVVFKITEIHPENKIVWLVTDCHLPWLNDKKEWKNTKIVWEISHEKDETKIEMTHVGLTPDVECYENCKKGWDHFINESLFKLFTENKGLPQAKKDAVAA